MNRIHPTISNGTYQSQFPQGDQKATYSLHVMTQQAVDMQTSAEQVLPPANGTSALAMTSSLCPANGPPERAYSTPGESSHDLVSEGSMPEVVNGTAPNDTRTIVPNFASSSAKMVDNIDAPSKTTTEAMVESVETCRKDTEPLFNGTANGCDTPAGASSVPSQSPVPRVVSSFKSTPSSKDTTPSTGDVLNVRKSKAQWATLRHKTAIPPDMPPEDYAQQCAIAAYASRLDPFVLHVKEFEYLRNHLTEHQVTTYLNIRNGILRLWVRNPLVAVTMEEAAGCARERRVFGLVDAAYQWLVRHGYINFGCIDLRTDYKLGRRSRRGTRKKIVVIGAGMAGLGCARQLQGLFQQYSRVMTEKGEDVPRVIVLESRCRIGGRIYSHALKKQDAGSFPDGLRCTAEMGAQIITGFDHGNPLNIILRGQLGLRYHTLTDESVLYDSNGSPVDKNRDNMVQGLYDDILKCTGIYHHKVNTQKTAGGDKVRMEEGRDSALEGGRLLRDLTDSMHNSTVKDEAARPSDIEKEHVVASMDKLPGKAHIEPGESSRRSAAEVASKLGWELKPGVHPQTTLKLDGDGTSREDASLGETMDKGVLQYQGLVSLTPKDLRLLNWHFANLEYANATNPSRLNLHGWDQDVGNGFEGQHAQVCGGYMQVPRAIWKYPQPLDVRFRKTVKKIRYTQQQDALGAMSLIETEDGDVFEADEVIVTLPLGVLKAQSMLFDPPLPEDKAGAIKRLGFGLLNKLIMVYDEPFWDTKPDMFGLLRDPTIPESLEQRHYSQFRGRFYLWWNCIKTSGRPMLIALMTGDAAYQAELSDDQSLAAEATAYLRKIFSSTRVPEPSEVIVTRWGSDPFAKGTYSYVDLESKPGDYDRMAQSVGNLHFAGEATCATHPATVHGAYISSLRAAAEVAESILGPLQIRSTLVEEKAKRDGSTRAASQKQKRKASPVHRAQEPHDLHQEAYQKFIQDEVLTRLGPRPTKPEKLNANPFLFYSKAQWRDCKAQCDEARRQTTGNESHRFSRSSAGCTGTNVARGIG